MESLAIAVTICFSVLATIFSYLAYRHSKERFRLELSEKRWEVYLATLEFCSAVQVHGGIPKPNLGDRNEKYLTEERTRIIKAAENSFRGIGYHKVQSLFGQEIDSRFKKLNEAYAWFFTPWEKPSAEEEHTHLLNVMKIAEELPELFKPYLFFGDYKNESRCPWISGRTPGNNKEIQNFR